jgi:hypothetical protein
LKSRFITIKSGAEYNSNDTMMIELATFTADRSNA